MKSELLLGCYSILLYLSVPKPTTMENIQKYIDKAVELGIEYAPKVVLAILTLWIGLWIVNRVVKLASKSMEKAGVDTTLQRFLANLISWTLKIVLFISVISMLGVATTSFVAILGAMGLAVGLSLQGSLGNLAGGVLVILFKPYRVGDLIKAQGEMGRVVDIQIFTTLLLNSQNEKIIIPNGAISNGNIKNYSSEGKVRVDISVGISYESNIQQARDVLMKVMENNPMVLQDPKPSVAVVELGDSSVNLSVRPWCEPENYFSVMVDVLEECKLALDAHEITIPFPQLDVHMNKVD